MHLKGSSQSPNSPKSLNQALQSLNQARSYSTPMFGRDGAMVRRYSEATTPWSAATTRRAIMSG
jgi:hypothetical protein